MNHSSMTPQITDTARRLTARLHFANANSTWIVRSASLMLLFLLTAAVCHASTNQPTIFVAPISGGARMYAWRNSMGEAIAEALLNQLASSRKFQALETSALESLRKETTIGSDGWMEPSQKTEKGHWLGADYMLAGKLTQFERPPTASGGGLVQGIEKLFPRKAKVKILWRIVNASTRTVVAQGTADSTKIREKFGFGNMAKGILVGGEDGDDALEQALNGVLSQIVYEIENLDLPMTVRTVSAVNQRQPESSASERMGKVEAVKPDFLIVSLGTKHGCKVGDKLELCDVIDVKNTEGKTVFSDEKPVGEVEIQMCAEERSKVSFTSLVPPKEGWVVRRKASGSR